MPLNSTGRKVQLMILDPGHFHAALVQKKMYSQIASQVHVYAPDGLELRDYMNRIEGSNTRESDPTHWETLIHSTPDYLENLLRERPGNVVVTAGNNRRKTEYLKSAVDAGLHVLADKPMCIDAAGWELLRSAFDAARRNNVLLYDIMTERFEITSILQRELMRSADVFGELRNGSPDTPAVSKESVHYLSKHVAGKPLSRPPWYFDVSQQGEGIVDVTTHLIDLVMWACFPDEVIDYAADIQMLRARHWPTLVTLPEFEMVTGQNRFPGYVQRDVHDDVLSCYCNGEMTYRIKGVHVHVSVTWDYRALEGGGDRHESRIGGSKADVVIHQGKAQNHQPELYLEPSEKIDRGTWERALQRFWPSIQGRFPGIELTRADSSWHVLIPSVYRVGHEAHFSHVMDHFLKLLDGSAMPQWEVPNMIAKYYTTTQALQLARNSK